MNRVNIVGRLARDPEFRENEAGTSKCQFTLALQRIGAKDGMQQADFINCVVWNKLAENFFKYQFKGDLVAVDGELRADNYTDRDGNKRVYNYVLCHQIDYLSSSKREDKGEIKKEEVKETDPFADFSNDVELTDDDLPF